MPTWLPQALHKYAVFEGRARRQEYWYFVLFYLISYFVLAVVDEALGLAWASPRGGHHGGLLETLFSLVMFIPSIAVTARRLHDTDRSGWWQLIYLVPLVGFLVMLVFLVLDSQPGSNRFGPNPKGAD